MRIRLKPWIFLTLLAAAIVSAAYVAQRARYRFVQSDAQMVALLPEQDLTRVFLNFEALRRAQLIGLLAASKPAAESDYQQFVQETGFDYTRDIDALAGEGDSKQLFFVLRGRFNWVRLREYATSHGGDCRNDVCRAPTSTPGRFASFLSVQPNVLALAVSTNPAAVAAMSPRYVEGARPIPSDPIWVQVSRSVLSNPRALPFPAQIFAMALESTDSVILSVQADPSRRSPFELKLAASCRNGAIADTTKRQLEIQTRLLVIELAREHQKPNPADLTGLLTSGSFQVVEKTVVGAWPIRTELLRRLQ